MKIRRWKSVVNNRKLRALCFIPIMFDTACSEVPDRDTSLALQTDEDVPLCPVFPRWPFPWPPGQVYVARDLPQIILDNSERGAVSEIDIPVGVNSPHLAIHVGITHTFVGDLVIQVSSPSGRVVTLSNRAGGSTDNFITTTDISNSLTTFGMAGLWQLNVRDLAALDQGTIDSYCLVTGSLQTN